MSTRGARRRRVDGSWVIRVVGALLVLLAPQHGVQAGPGSAPPASAAPRSLTIAGGHRETVALGTLKAGQTYRLQVALQSSPIHAEDRVTVELEGAGTDRLTKVLHAGDPDLYLPYRPRSDGQAQLVLASGQNTRATPLSVRIEWTELTTFDADRAAVEAEPNDSWQQACELRLGRDVYGTADDVDYLNNADEGKSGLDWFRFEVTGEKPNLVYFQLDLLDRDVAVNLRVYTVDPGTGRPELYLTGKDPMEIVHDRERERYSKHISRTFVGGTYYLEVNANHPDYILRTRVLPVPPYRDPRRRSRPGCTTS